MPAKKGATDTQLSDDEARFVEEYLIDRNGTSAYCRTYPESSRANAASAAHYLLKKPKVQAAIRSGTKDLERMTRVSAAKVIQHAATIAFLDLGELFDLSVNDFKPKAPREVPIDIRRALQGAVVTRKKLKTDDDEDYETERIEYKLPDKNAALEKLFKNLGLYNELSPLEVLLAALPPDVAATVRAALAAKVHGGGTGEPLKPEPIIGGEADPESL